jgi:hypothetical protein
MCKHVRTHWHIALSWHKKYSADQGSGLPPVDVTSLVVLIGRPRPAVELQSGPGPGLLLCTKSQKLLIFRVTPELWLVLSSSAVHVLHRHGALASARAIGT